jgi:hypothetical protein
MYFTHSLSRRASGDCHRRCASVLVPVIVALTLAVVPAYAQRVGTQLVVLKIDLTIKEHWLENQDGTAIKDGGRQQAGTLAAANEIHLRKGNLTRLVIARSNPLNYSYQSERGELVETANYQAASAFSKILISVVQILGGPAAGAPPAESDTARTKTSSHDDVNAILKRYDLNEQDELDRFFNALQDQSEALSVKAKKMPALFNLAKIDQTRARQEVCGTETPCTWGLDELERSLTAAFDTLKSLRDDLIKNAGNADVRSDPINSVVSLVLTKESDAMTTLETVKTFVSAVARIDQDLVLDDQASYDASHAQPIAVSRTPLSLDGKQAAKDKTEYTFTFHPDNPVTYGVGGAYVYSFVRQPVYKAVDHDGRLVIADTAAPADYVGHTVSSILSIAPTRWVGTPFTPVAEVGANVNKDFNRVGLFFGVGFSPFGLFHFGGGYTLQQVDRLGEGLAIGQTVASAADVKTRPTFRPGAYLHISVLKKLGGS